MGTTNDGTVNLGFTNDFDDQNNNTKSTNVKTRETKENQKLFDENFENSSFKSECASVLEPEDYEALRFKFRGNLFRSLRERGKSTVFNSTREELPIAKILKESTPDLNRSQYSLVSCGELTPEAVQLWLGLPEEVKYDPALASFRQLYEKEQGKDTSAKPRGERRKVQRLPLVSSAPLLNNNLHVVSEEFGAYEESKISGIKEDSKPDPPTEKKISTAAKARYYVKMTLLVGCWAFCTAVFLACEEKEVAIRTTSVAPGEIKDFIIPDSDSAGKFSLKLDLSGPFMTKNAESVSEAWNTNRSSPNEVGNGSRSSLHEVGNETTSGLSEGRNGTGSSFKDVRNGTGSSSEIRTEDGSRSEVRNGTNGRLEVWLERWTVDQGLRRTRPVRDTEQSTPEQLLLLENKELDFNIGEKRTVNLNLDAPVTNQSTELPHTVMVLRMRTSVQETAPLEFSYTVNPLDAKIGILYAAALLVGLYVLIIFEIINRTMAAVLLSTASLAILALTGERPTVPELISWLDVETLLLLFSMMLLVAIMAETGMFDFLAVYTFEVTKGKLWPLIGLLSMITALLSTVLDNVTTVLLMVPVTIRLCEVMDLDPIPILMSMVLFSNIGGTATPVGDPPNVIIASNKAVQDAGINFTNFTLHMSLGIVLVCIQSFLQLRFMFRDTNKLRLGVPREIQDLRHQISIWKRAADSLPHLSQDQRIVRERLERKVKKLTLQLEALQKESNKRVCPKHSFESTLADLKSKYKIRDKILLVKATVAITFVVTMFFLHAIPAMNRISLGWTALLGAILLLLLADREELEPVLHRVEWSTLLFFAALFVFMEALSKLGLIEFIGNLTESLILGVSESARLAVAILLILWVSGITSAFVDNIPLTTMMVRVVTALGANPRLALPLQPLVWALSFGACLGGNGTLIGASANVVCAGVAEQHGYKFTFIQFLKVGFPLMIGHLIVITFYLLISHCAFQWH